MKISGQFIRFGLVGAVGFVVDTGVLYLLRDAGLDLYSARVVSFVCGATFTWLGNRFFTFAGGARRGRRIGGEWAVYVAAMTLGALINYGTYAILIFLLPLFHAQPWMAVAVGTAASMTVNFANARRILHQPPA